MEQRTRISAYGLIEKDQKILLCRLAPHVMKSAGMWTLPGGGLDFGEHPEEAMIREVKEETGLNVQVGKFVAIDSLSDEVKGRQYHSIRIIYRADILSGEIEFEEGGTTDRCEWFSKKEALALPLVGHAQVGVQHLFGDKE